MTPGTKGDRVDRILQRSGLPRSARDLIIDVVRRTGLSEDGRADVASELVAHFQDGLAAGRSVEQLLAAFGDGRTAGRLIGRGKRAAAPGVPRLLRQGDPIVYTLIRSVRYAARRLVRTPGFTVTAVLSLALGIGANTAIFSVVNALVLRDKPLAAPEELVEVYLQQDDFAFSAFSYPDYEDFVEATSGVFAGVATVSFALAQVDAEDGVSVVPVEMVTGNYFPLQGVPAAVGRTLQPEDHIAPGQHWVVVLGHGYWTRAFGGDPDIVGRDIRVNGRAYTIVGVASEAYPGAIRGLQPDLYAPIMMLPEIQAAAPGALERRGSQSNFLKARLAPGVGVTQANAAVAGFVRTMKEREPRYWQDVRGIALIPTEDVVMNPAIDRILVPATGMLLAVVGLVLLIACANLASFLLARATDRRKEIAVRLALGATRRGLVGQLLSETMLLSLVGGVAGLVLAKVLLASLVSADLPLPVPITLDLSLDATVLGYCLLLSLGAGAFFGLVPALQSTNPDVAPTLRDESAGGGGPAKVTLRNVLVVGQVSVSLVLLVSAGLFLRSFVARQAIDAGFGHQPAGVMEVVLPAAKYDDETGRLFMARLVERLERLPGVQSVGMTANLHMNQLNTQTIVVNVDGVDPPPGRDGFPIDYASIDDGFFDAAGIRLLRGRNFKAGDLPDARRVVIVNETMAQRFWPNDDAVGKLLRVSDDPDMFVVGVVSNVKVRSLGEDPRPFVYEAYSQNYSRFMTVLARTTGDAAVTAREMMAAGRELDPELMVAQNKTLARHLATMMLGAQLGAAVLSVFAALALLLASVGLYGIVSYAVAQRTREVGIRVSLGAEGRSVIRLLMGSGMKLVLLGSTIGLALALAAARGLSRFLYGVGALDLATFLATPVVLLAVASLAAYIPARRASRIDPVRALKAE